MNDRMRTALRELGDVPPPPDLAGAALARAGRDRRRAVTGLVSGIAVLAAAAVTVPTLVLGRAAPETTTAATRPVVVVAGYTASGPRDPVTTGVASEVRIWDPETRRYVDPPSPYRVYDRASGRYVRPPWRTAVPSPDGRWVAVSAVAGGSWQVGIVAADRVLDRTAVRWVADGQAGGHLPEASSPGTWSPDGSRLYLNSAMVWIGEKNKQMEIRGLVVDPRTGAADKVTLTRRQPLRQQGSLVFGPRGTGFAVASVVFPDRGRPAEGDLAFYDEDGTFTAAVPTGALTAPGQPFSPDGRLVALHTLGPLGGSTRVLRVATGAEVGRADGAVVGWIDDGHYAVRVGASLRVIELSSGRVVAEQQVAPAGRQLLDVWLATVDGPAPPGAIVL